MNNNKWASERTIQMPASMFSIMDAAIDEARQKRLELIDLSIGSSDLPAPEAAMKVLRQATRLSETHGYCLHACTQPLRNAAAVHLNKRYSINLDPEKNIITLIGSQEGFGHLLFAITDSGDQVLAPDPGYPSYFGATSVAGLQQVVMPLLEENMFLPDLTAIPSETAKNARAMIISYPNNPTAAVAPAAFLQEAIDFCLSYDILLIHDFPYVDMVYGDYEAPSVLAQPGGIDIAVELYSCSKSYHMGGFRIGWAAGNQDAVQALARVKGAIDFNQYFGIQQAAIAAITQPRAATLKAAAVFETRRNVLVDTLNKSGWQTSLPQASMYVWTRLPLGLTDSFDFTVNLAKETGVCLAPGRGFGKRGEGFVRFALVREPDALVEAVKRIFDFL